ncbi:protein root uvb sensitive 2 [Quercus suber]|uniref:Protein root uvb sensitive 2 n=1 Tax=Quercus suber TaxID=58331 RepID=A0AAW0JCY7_QUESU
MSIMNLLLDKIKMQTKDKEQVKVKPPETPPLYWTEISDSVSRRFHFLPDGQLSMKLLDDSRSVIHRTVDSFLSKFFPSGYPYSVSEGYLRYTQFRALQHMTSATLSVLSTQSLLFAAGLRPTPAQATAVSWILKDGMQHVGKLICSNLGARMDSEPKSWRILADVLYDLGTGLEVLSPMCPHLFLEVAGNLSDLFAKGEAISTLFNVVGLGAGIFLASTVCSSMQGKLVVGPVLSVLHVYSVVEEMRAAPVNTLNPQRTAMIVADFLKVVKPSKLRELKEIFPEEKFLLCPGSKWVDMVLENNATGEDALRGWLVAAYAAQIEKSSHVPSASALQEAYDKMNDVFYPFLSELQAKGWHTDRFLDGTGSRFAW